MAETNTLNRKARRAAAKKAAKNTSSTKMAWMAVTCPYEVVHQLS